MKNNFILEAVAVIGVMLSLLFLLNPFHWLMSDMVAMTVLCVAALLFLWFVSFVFAERALDEREALHRSIAAQLGYYGGVSVLMLIILVQKLYLHMLDPWMVGALGVMLIMKVIGRVYAKLKL